MWTNKVLLYHILGPPSSEDPRILIHHQWVPEHSSADSAPNFRNICKNVHHYVSLPSGNFVTCGTYPWINHRLIHAAQKLTLAYSAHCNRLRGSLPAAQGRRGLLLHEWRGGMQDLYALYTHVYIYIYIYIFIYNFGTLSTKYVCIHILYILYKKGQGLRCKVCIYML